MRQLAHLLKLVWQESGKLARIFYGIGIALPIFLSSSLSLKMQSMLDIEAPIVLSQANAVLVALGFGGLWTIYALSRITLRQEDELKPNLIVSFSEQGGVVETPAIREIAKTGEILGEVKVVYIRVLVISASKKKVKNRTGKQHYLQMKPIICL